MLCPPHGGRRASRGVALGLLVALMLLACAAAPQAHGQGAPSVRTVNFGFNKATRANRWTPAMVSLVNPGPAGEYEIVVSDDASAPRVLHRHRVWLPSRALVQAQLFLRLPVCEKVRFELRRGQQSLGEPYVLNGPWFVPPTEALILGLNPAQRSYGVTQPREDSAVSRRIRMVNLADTSGFPERWTGYDAADCIIIGGVGRGDLTEAQQQAIVRWVANGGMAVLTPSDDAAWLDDSLLAALSPVEIVGRRNLYDPAVLVEAFGPGLTAGRAIPLWEARVLRGNTLLKSGELPLIVAAPFGAGSVVFFAFDASDEHVRGWAQMNKLYWHVLELRDPLNLLDQTALPRTAPELLHGMVGARVAPRAVVALLLAANLGLFVAAYLLARRRRRQEYAWVVIGLAAPAFALLVYALGGRLSGVSQASVGVITVTHTAARPAGAVPGAAAPQAVGRATSYVGVVRPESGVCDLGRFHDASAFAAAIPSVAALNRNVPQELGALDFMDDDIKWLRGVALKPRWLMPFELIRAERGAAGIEAEAAPGAKGIAVRIRNRSPQTLRAPFVAFNRNVAALRDLAPGEEVKLVLDRGTALATPREVSQSLLVGERGLRRARAVQALFSRSFEEMRDAEPRLYAWVERAGGEPAVEARGLGAAPLERGEELWIVDLPWAPGESQVLLPKGAAWMVPETAAVSIFRQGRWVAAAGSFSLPVTFRLPPPLRPMQPTRMVLYAEVGGARAEVKVSLWNVRQAKWQEFEPAAGGISVPRPADFYLAPRGEVRAVLAVSPPAQAGLPAEAGQLEPPERLPWVKDFDLEIEGAVP